MTIKSISLGDELAVLARAAQGIVDILDAEAGGADEDHMREAVALLCLLGARLAQLRRAVVGALDPKSLLARFNEADAPQPGDDPDIHLLAWRGGHGGRPRPRRTK